MLNSYRDLIVWQKSVDLAIEIYRLTALFPKEELYGLASQMRRAAVSIPSNIAEGYARKHRRENVQFCRISFGSGAELETQIVIARRLKLAPGGEFKKSEELLGKIMKMLNKLIASLASNSPIG